MFADDFAQTPSRAIARDGRPESARRNEAGSKAGFITHKNAEQQQTAALDAAVCFHVLKFARPRQSPALWKGKLL